MNDLYDMKLHDQLEISTNVYVTRVPGGWIYKEIDEQVGGHWVTSMIFVPFDNEFQSKDS